MARWLNGIGWAGTGYTPSFAPGAGPGAAAATPTYTTTTRSTSIAATATPSAGTMTSMRTALPASEPASFMSFPPGAGSVAPATPSGTSSGGGLPGGVRSPTSGSVFTPDGGGVKSDDVSGDVAQDSGGGDGSTTIVHTTPPMLAPGDYVTGVTTSWPIAAILALGGATAWYFGFRLIGGAALAGGAFVGYRAWRRP